MKVNLIKVIIILGICVALFGAANVKSCAINGVSTGIDKIEQGVDKIKNSDTVKNSVSEVGNTVTDALKGFKFGKDAK